MAGDGTGVAGPGDQPDAPAAPSEKTIARLRTRAEQLRADRPRPSSASDTDPLDGLGPADAATTELLDRWTEEAPSEAAEPLRNRSNAIAAAVAFAVVALALLGGWALISGSDDGEDPPGPDRAGEDDATSALRSEVPSLDDLASDVTIPPGPEQGLQVTAQGLSILPDRFDPGLREGTFAVVLANPHERWLAQGVQVTVTFLDEAGTALGTDEGFVEVVLPGQRVAVASLFLEAPTVPVAGMDVAVEVARWRETGPFEGTFTVTEVQTGDADFGGVRTTFTITSGFEDPLTDVAVTAVYRAADGRIIGGSDTFVERLEPGVPTPAEILLLANVDPAEIASTELYPTAAIGYVPDGYGG